MYYQDSTCNKIYTFRVCVCVGGGGGERGVTVEMAHIIVGAIGRENFPVDDFQNKRFYLDFEEELSFSIYSEILKNWLQEHFLSRWMIVRTVRGTTKITV